MSLSSPYGQDGGSQSPLGGPSMFGTQNWGNWQQPQQGGALTGSGSLPPAPPAQPPQSSTTNLPPWAGGDLGNTTQSTTGGPGNMMQPVVGSARNMMQPVTGAAQAPSDVTQGPVNMMVNALASPTPAPQNPVSFTPAPTTAAAPMPPQAPANPMSFLGAPVPAPTPTPAQPQNPYGF